VGREGLWTSWNSISLLCFDVLNSTFLVSNVDHPEDFTRVDGRDGGGGWFTSHTAYTQMIIILTTLLFSPVSPNAYQLEISLPTFSLTDPLFSENTCSSQL
jgi:hypothetical protein